MRLQTMPMVLAVKISRHKSLTLYMWRDIYFFITQDDMYFHSCISIRVLKIIYSRTCKIKICVQNGKVQRDMDAWTWEIGNDVLMNLILREDNLSATTCWWTLFWGRIISVKIWIQPWAQRSHQKQQGHMRELTIRRKWPEWLYWKKMLHMR